MADEKKARELLEKVRRLPHNKKCANCDKDSMAGHGDVCVKFGTFVCHTCKSAHQAFSHRCKSVSLSNWTVSEVLALQDANGGGNLHARQTWLGRLDGKLVLRPDDPLDRVKQFVQEAYINKRYYLPEGSSSSSGSGSSPTTQANHTGATPQSSSSSSVRPPTPPPASAGPAPSSSAAKAKTADFLDFDADFQGAAPPHAAAAAHDDDGWHDFQGSSSRTAAAAAAAATNGGSAFAFMSAPAPAPAHHADWGDFTAALPASAPAPAPVPVSAAPRPVMMTSVRSVMDDPFAGLANNGPVYGALPAQPPRPPQPGMGMGVGVGMGMGFGMGMGMQMQQQPPPRPAPTMMGGFGGQPPMGPPRGMGMANGGAPPVGGIPGCGFVTPSGPGPFPPQQLQPQARPPMPGMGGFGPMGGMASAASASSSSYRPAEPDPFAGLNWRGAA